MITTHHDGHGLNEQLLISHDERDVEKGGGASHRYMVEHIPGDERASAVVASIQFQHGPRDVKGSKPGITDAAMLGIVIDRYRAFQAGPFACRENALVLTKLEEALHWMKHRADERAKRGVLGKLEK